MNDEATTVDDDHLIIHFGVVMHFICFIIYYNIQLSAYRLDRIEQISRRQKFQSIRFEIKHSPSAQKFISAADAAGSAINLDEFKR